MGEKPLWRALGLARCKCPGRTHGAHFMTLLILILSLNIYEVLTLWSTVTLPPLPHPSSNSEVSTPESRPPFLRRSGDRSPEPKSPGLQGSASLFQTPHPDSRAGRPPGGRPSTGVRGVPGDQGAARGLRPQVDSARPSAPTAPTSRAAARRPGPAPFSSLS